MYHRHPFLFSGFLFMIGSVKLGSPRRYWCYGGVAGCYMRYFRYGFKKVNEKRIGHDVLIKHIL